MARNKYPEETVNLILDVSLELFLSKGYENTSIQDIIDHLGGLSKGAIYHHFKSKEAILIAVYDRMSRSIETQMTGIRENKNLNGLQKIQKMFMSSLNNLNHRELLASTPNLLKNPRLLAIQLNSTINDVVPNYIEPVIKEGIEDGSIQTEYPKELAQVLILMSNIWMNPLIYPMTAEEVSTRIAFFDQMTQAMGLSILNTGLEEHLRDVQKKFEEKQQDE